jgi:hypothetical protein
MESSVTIPLAYYDELKDDSNELKILKKDSTYSIVWRLGCNKMIEALNKDETIKALNCKISNLLDESLKSEISYKSEINKLKELLKDSKELNRVLTAKLEEKRSPFGFLNKIYLYFK